LSALCLRDKLLQRATLLVLEPGMEQLFHTDTYAYRPRRNVEMAHAKACEHIRCGLSWLVDADVRAFFDNIPQRPLLKRVRRHVPDKDLVRLMEQWIAMGPSHASILSPSRGIPQGAILAPATT
jgi:retron-type reverse transcriptase